MKWLILFLTIQYAVADDSCDKLASVVQNLETSLMDKRADKCDQNTAEQLLPGNSADQKKLIEESRCQSLAVLESRIRDLENEHSLLMGFQKLKDELQTQQKKIGTTPLLPEALKIGVNFKDNLIIAQSLELMLNTSDDQGVAFISSLKKIPVDKRADAKALKEQIAILCKGVKAQTGACSEDFNPSDKAVVEINALIEKDFNQDSFNNWRDALKIQKKDAKPDETYSFNEMLTALKDAKTDTDQLGLTPDEIKIIRSLPDFKSSNGISLDNLNAGKWGLDNQNALEKFKSLTSDLQTRQELEVRSKVALAWSEYRSSAADLSDDQKTKCNAAVTDYSSAEACMVVLKQIKDKNLDPGDRKTKLSQLLDSFDHIKNYRKKIAETNDNCFTGSISALKSSATLSTKCDIQLDKNDSDILLDILALRAVKDKIIDENKNLFTFRNYAVENLDSQKCANKEPSSVGDCYTDLETQVSKQAVALLKTGMDIAVVYETPDSKTDIKDLCASKTIQLTANESYLCDPPKGTSPDRKMPDHSKDAYVAPNEVPGGSHEVRDAFTQGAGSLLGNITRMFYNQNQMSPYPTYNYWTPNSSQPLLSVSDSILYPARVYGGYGLYMSSTPLTSLGAYTPITPGGGSYFYNTYGK
jgi:hypothetical protein